MSKFDKSMQEIFNIDPFDEPEKNTKSLPVIQKKDGNLESDLNDAYEQTKDNLQDLIDQGKEAMEEILAIAKEGQHPRAFEVYGTLLKNVVDANKELLNVQKQMREMQNAGQKTGPTHIDKAVFVGTPADLNKLLKGNNENDISG